MADPPVPNQWTPPGLPPALLEQVLGSMSEGVLVHGSDGTLIAHNRAAEVILGVTGSELRTEGPLPLPWKASREDGTEIPNEDHPGRIALRSDESSDGTLIRIHRLDGSAVWIRAASRPVEVGAERLAITTFSDVTSLRDSESDVEQLTRRDPLTGLATRLTFEQFVEGAVARAADGRHRASVIALGLDHFSLLNQRLGVTVGDEVLVATSSRLQHTVDPRHAVARIGDDQFAVLLEPAPDDDGLLSLALEIRIAADAGIAVGGTEYIPSVTAGIASFPSDTTDAGALLASAVEALGAAKRLERGSILFSRDFDEDRGLHYSIHQGIRRAIDLDAVRLWYQPVVAVESGREVGVESLFRLTEAEGSGSGILTPEILGALGPRIAGHVLGLLAGDARSMQAAGCLPLIFSVNLTAVDLLIPRIKEQAITLARELTDLGSRLVVEVSEKIGLRDPSLIRPILEELRSASAAISIDDFGTGTNSLALLRELPLDSLKLDSTFVAGAMINATDRAIIKAAVMLADELGLSVVAEGVEDAATLDFVRGQGIRMAQGYHLGRPCPIEEWISR